MNSLELIQKPWCKQAFLTSNTLVTIKQICIAKQAKIAKEIKHKKLKKKLIWFTNWL